MGRDTSFLDVIINRHHFSWISLKLRFSKGGTTTTTPSHLRLFICFLRKTKYSIFTSVIQSLILQYTSSESNLIQSEICLSKHSNPFGDLKFNRRYYRMNKKSNLYLYSTSLHTLVENIFGKFVTSIHFLLQF